MPFEIRDTTQVEWENPGGLPPGADRECTAGERDPVVLVHNTSGNRQVPWQMFSPLLANEGFCVYTFTYGTVGDFPWPIDAVGGIGPIPESARELGEFVDGVLARTGAQKVDIVGHSQGTLVSAYWLRLLDGAGKVDSSVAMAPLWNGTDLYGPIPGPVRDVLDAACPACADMRHGSPVLTALHDVGMFDATVTYTNVITRNDTVVVPYTSGYLEGPTVTNVVVQDVCPSSTVTHLRMLADPVVAALVLDALDPDGGYSSIASASCGHDRWISSSQ